MKILVTGGAGYIGSQTVKELLKRSFKVITFDNLEIGHRQAVVGGKFEKGDLRNKKDLERTFIKHKIEAVIHFAAYASVPDSVKNPAKYFENNLTGGLNLLEVMRKYKVDKMVFSSSAAVYGEPKKIPIKEDDPKKPTNPYGLSKLQYEQILQWYDRAYKIRSISLRYFCAAGADLEGELGEDHRPETHLIPLVLQAALSQKPVNIYGTDYETPDGTGIRDFIHILDLADVHIRALSYLSKNGKSSSYNCGIGKGYSVREVIKVAEKVTSKKIPYKETTRRPGDPARLVASVSKIKKELGWQAGYPRLEDIIKSAWNWHKSHPKGYRS